MLLYTQFRYKYVSKSLGTKHNVEVHSTIKKVHTFARSKTKIALSLENDMIAYQQLSSISIKWLNSFP